jgi:YebC/PmpR family DNA-binding regulatory protein
MSGHSKWANIRVRKGAQDAKRGKIYTRHSKLIEIAAREGGNGDPEKNGRLATAVENAKMDNVPNANIERAIKKGTGELKGAITEAITYEAYGPGGVACIIEGFTDNKNRTLNNVRSAIERRGGKWAESGSVLFLFDRKGVIHAEGKLSDDAELGLIDAGAEDIDRSGTSFTVTTAAGNWSKVRDVLKDDGCTIHDAGLKYVAKQHMAIADVESARKLMEFIDAIEEDEDVSEVHTNADIAEEIGMQLS